MRGAMKPCFASIPFRALSSSSLSCAGGDIVFSSRKGLSVSRYGKRSRVCDAPAVGQHQIRDLVKGVLFRKRSSLRFCYSRLSSGQTIPPSKHSAPFLRLHSATYSDRTGEEEEAPGCTCTGQSGNATQPSSLAITSGAAPGGDVAEFNAFLREKVSSKASRKLFDAVAQAEEGEGAFGSTVPNTKSYQIAIRGLVGAGRAGLALSLYKIRMRAALLRPDDLLADTALVASVLRAILREKRKRKASDDENLLFAELRAACALDLTKHSRSLGCEDTDGQLRRQSTVLLSVIGLLAESDRVLQGTELAKALRSFSAEQGYRAAAATKDYNNAIRFLGKKRSLAGVFAILDAMRACKVEFDNETFEFLSNSVVRQVEFVTGAVSMATLPEPLSGEVAFVGRSNVGKSSLVNMICNRKALAYVSGRPGKTQQFNYFIVNKKDGRSAFYLVDLPGVGYAEVPKAVQRAWISFMDTYLSSRPSLNVIFHLVDGRHGALEDDEVLMRHISSTGFNGSYVVILTKMDKVDKQRVRTSVIDKTRNALVRSGCAAQTPILITSSVSRLGRDQIWKYLRKVLKM